MGLYPPAKSTQLQSPKTSKRVLLGSPRAYAPSRRVFKVSWAQNLKMGRPEPST